MDGEVIAEAEASSASLTAAGPDSAAAALADLLAQLPIDAHPVLRAAATRAVGEALPGSDVRALTEPPVAGAVRLACAAARGVALPP